MLEGETVEERFGGEQFAYLTTTGRVSGRPHEIEIWFGALGDTIYLLSGGGDRRGPGRSDWVLNIAHTPAVRVRLGAATLDGRGRLVGPDSDEDRIARALLFNKYQPGSDDDLRSWRRRAVPVAIDLERPA